MAWINWLEGRTKSCTKVRDPVPLVWWRHLRELGDDNRYLAIQRQAQLDAGHLARLDQHVRNYFAGHKITEHVFDEGPTTRLIPEFKILCVHPAGEFDFYTYLSIGNALIEHEGGRRLEFLVTSLTYNDVWVEVLTMTAYYHSTEWLELGHTFPIGHPLLRDSTCDYMLVTLPYPFGPTLEISCLGDAHVFFLWLLPITAAEKTYRFKSGLEALEQKFDTCEIDYLDMQRPSVVHDFSK